MQQVPSAPQGSKLTRRPNTAKSSSSSTNPTTTNGNAAAAKKTNASSLAAQRREAQRKQLMELKRKNKLAMSAGEQQQPNQNQVVEIFVNEQSNSWLSKIIWYIVFKVTKQQERLLFIPLFHDFLLFFRKNKKFSRF